MNKRFVWLAALLLSAPSVADDLGAAVLRDYDDYLARLFDHFHRNPELSTVEFKTAERMADAGRAASRGTWSGCQSDAGRRDLGALRAA